MIPTIDPFSGVFAKLPSHLCALALIALRGNVCTCCRAWTDRTTQIPQTIKGFAVESLIFMSVRAFITSSSSTTYGGILRYRKLVLKLTGSFWFVHQHGFTSKISFQSLLLFLVFSGQRTNARSEVSI
jgi:hypothetical protein